MTKKLHTSSLNSSQEIFQSIGAAILAQKLNAPDVYNVTKDEGSNASIIKVDQYKIEAIAKEVCKSQPILLGATEEEITRACKEIIMNRIAAVIGAKVTINTK